MRDDPEAVLMTEYPSSNSSETQFQNKTKYIIHDPYPAPPVGLLKTLGPHHLMYGWGKQLPVTSDLPPPAMLLEHWAKIFGEEGVPVWERLREDKTYITSFPFETLTPDQQVIDPDTLYHLHSKAAIAEVPCSQAAVYDKVEFPCVLKLSHGYAGLGNFFIRKPSDYQAAQAQLKSQWPDAPLIINQLLTDIIGDYGVQFYLDKKGKMTWLGFTQQVFNETGKWTGGVFNAEIQDQLHGKFLNIAESAAEYLHQKSYFGVVGIDILEDKTGQCFLVDINPRLTGITPFLIASRLFLAEGFIHGIYAASVALKGNLETVISQVEEIRSAKVIILSAYQEEGADDVICHLSISGSSHLACKTALAALTR